MKAIIDHLSNEKKINDYVDKKVTSNLMGVSFATDICDEPTISNGVTTLSREARSPPVLDESGYLLRLLIHKALTRQSRTLTQ